MSSPTTGDVTVQDNPDKNRFEAVLDVDGEQAVVGFADYERHGSLIAFVHTDVDPAYGGQGIGTSLIEGSLVDVRSRELTVRVVCPFYVTYFEEHPEHADLLGA